MSEYIIQEQTLTDIADAIRSKTHSEEEILTVEMADKIMGISGGSDIEYCTTAEFNAEKDLLPIGTSYYITDDQGSGGGNANIWYGTHEEYEEIEETIDVGTQVCFIDDVNEGDSFSGEIYDDDEVEIGLWNGEKLYRKVCHPTFPAKNTWGSFTVDIPNNAKIKNYYGVAYFTAGVTFNIPMYYASDTHIFINGGDQTGSNVFGCHWNYSQTFVRCDFIVEYTKENE